MDLMLQYKGLVIIYSRMGEPSPNNEQFLPLARHLLTTYPGLLVLALKFMPSLVILHVFEIKGCIFSTSRLAYVPLLDWTAVTGAHFNFANLPKLGN